MNNVMLSLTISLLFGIGTFLILRREMMKVIIGFGIVSQGDVYPGKPPECAPRAVFKTLHLCGLFLHPLLQGKRPGRLLPGRPTVHPAID